MKQRKLFAFVMIGLVMFAGCRCLISMDGDSFSSNQPVEASGQEDLGKIVATPKQDNYSGLYADMQETSHIYSNLNLIYQEDGTYEAIIGLYRLTTLEGIAKLDGETLFFEDGDFQVKGSIIIKESGAILTITESKFEYIQEGDIFEFSTKVS